MENRRNEQTMMKLILQIAQADDRVRAVIMNGSRASPGATKDVFQDYDIVFIVTNVEELVDDPHWIRQFGDLLISLRVEFPAACGVYLKHEPIYTQKS